MEERFKVFVSTHFLTPTHSERRFSVAAPDFFSGRVPQHPSPLCCCGCDPSDAGWLAGWLALPGCVIPAGGDGHGTGSVYILPREHLVFIRLFKNPLQPLRPDWRVACIGAHCLPAGHRSEYTHTYNLIFPHKDNRAVAAGLLCFFLHACTRA